MHEFSLAVGIVESVIKALEGREVKRVREVNLEVGELTLVNPEQLSFGFEVASEDSIVKGAKLKIHLKPAKIRCNNCDYVGGIKREKGEYRTPLVSFQCPKCGGFSVEVLEGKELNLKNLKADVEE